MALPRKDTVNSFASHAASRRDTTSAATGGARQPAPQASVPATLTQAELRQIVIEILG